MTFLTQSERMALTRKEILEGKSGKGIPEPHLKNFNKFDIATAEGTTLQESDSISKSNSVYYPDRRKCYGDDCKWILITITAGMSISDQEDLNFLLGIIEGGKEYNFGTTLNNEVCGQFEYKDTGFSSQFSSQFASQSDMLHTTALNLRTSIMNVFEITDKHSVICVENEIYLKKSIFNEDSYFSMFSDQFSDQFYKGA